MQDWLEYFKRKGTWFFVREIAACPFIGLGWLFLKVAQVVTGDRFTISRF